MEAQDKRRIWERRKADQHSDEGRRIDQRRRIWKRRHGAREEMTDGGRLDRRGEYPSLFATLGYRLLRGVRRMDSDRRGDVVRRFFIRRCLDRRAP